MIAAGNWMSGNTVELRPSDRRQLKVAAWTEKDDNTNKPNRSHFDVIHCSQMAEFKATNYVTFETAFQL